MRDSLGRKQKLADLSLYPVRMVSPLACISAYSHLGAKTYCACDGQGLGLFGYFVFCLSSALFSPSL